MDSMTDPQPDPQPEVDRIVADLRAALDAVEVAARKAKPGPWTQDGGSIYATHPTDEVVDWVYDDSWEHIALNDPARVLALVAAHREILDVYEDAAFHADLPPGVHDGRDWDEKVRDEEVAAALEQVVRCLAAAYADRDSSDESGRQA